MQLPNTARADRSIWRIVPRSHFETHIDCLHGKAVVPEAQVLKKEDWPKDRSEYLFTFEIEKQIADDFAFIAAYEYGVQYVTAATVVSPCHDSTGMVIRMAANEGISGHVCSAIRRLLDALERCAAKKLSREYCAATIFDLVVELNTNKLLGRLRSARFRRPPHERGNPRSPLTLRLKQHIQSMASRHQHLDKFQELSSEIDNLHLSAATLDSVDSNAIPGCLRTLVKAFFDLTIDGFSFPARMREFGFPASVLDGRDVCEVGKIANYWRICLSLTRLSRVYRDSFANISLDVLEPYSPLVHEGQERHVHAEVQMVVFYELSSTSFWPRFIGASKEACFLCHAFVSAHGRFSLSKAHRQIFPKWTVPDVNEYSDESLHRLQHTISLVDQVVLRTSEEPIIPRSLPLQSSINLLKVVLPSPSLTTASVTSNNTGSTTPTASHLRETSIEVGTPVSLQIYNETVTYGSAHEAEIQASEVLTISNHLPASVSIGWLDLHLQFEVDQDIPCIDTDTAGQTGHIWSGATVYVWITDTGESDSMTDSSERIVLQQLEHGKDHLIKRKEEREGCGTGDPYAMFVLVRDQHQAVRVKCVWHKYIS
ncbi:hypothetical protein IQ07DRAFT_238069 [Pyrenochaeta sp. DS3sAY3a]|nr:hypothetical protein IQ07DRAFT_238069 [Pyrenochaeta sp. DS3sAY3a]